MPTDSNLDAVVSTFSSARDASALLPFSHVGSLRLLAHDHFEDVKRGRVFDQFSKKVLAQLGKLQVCGNHHQDPVVPEVTIGFLISSTDDKSDLAIFVSKLAPPSHWLGGGVYRWCRGDDFSSIQNHLALTALYDFLDSTGVHVEIQDRTGFWTSRLYSDLLQPIKGTDGLFHRFAKHFEAVAEGIVNPEDVLKHAVTEELKQVESIASLLALVRQEWVP
jgi:hypothetical protein